MQKTLMNTKNAFREQIFAVVKMRMPFQAKGNVLSNLAAMNTLLHNPSMISDAQEGAKKIIDQAEDRSSSLVKAMQGFQKLLGDPEQMQQLRNKWASDVFPDKEEVNEYLLLTAAYIEKHIDDYVEAIQSLRDYLILEEKYKLWTNNVSREQMNDAMEKAINELEKCPMTITDSLVKCIATTFSQQKDWKLTEKWAINFAEVLKKYQEQECELVKKYRWLLFNS